jgi:hypothetical protein
VTRTIEVTGETVRELRRRRLQGARASELVTYLRGIGVGLLEASAYLEEGFSIPAHIANRLSLLQDPETKSLNLVAVDALIEPGIAEAEAKITAPAPFPEVMRRRDRYTFRSFAQRTGNILLVRGANPASGPYIGKPGFRVRPAGMPGYSRESEPNAGLLALDPSREDRRAELLAWGISAGTEEEGFILRNKFGEAFYDGYCLHGVYNGANGRNTWTGRDGERWRAELNQESGEELIQFGPVDTWVGRTGPRPPVIAYHPSGRISNLLDITQMKGYYKQAGINWSDLYPEDQEHAR